MRFYGERPRQTVRGYTILLNGEPVGIGGISREHGINKLFSDYKPELEPHLRSMPVLRAIKATQRLASEYPFVVGVAEHEKGAELMERMGLTHIREEYFAWLN